MIVEYDNSFYKRLTKIKDESILKRIKKQILDLENSEGLLQIRNIKKLSGHKTYYRIRIGDFRLGFETISESTIRLITIAHRKDIYKTFP